MSTLTYWLLSLFVFAALVYNYNAHAETAVWAGGWSDHPLSDYDYNENHKLVAFEHGSVMAGYFRNSYDEDALLAGYLFTRSVGHWEGSLMVGATYGYRDCFRGYGEGQRRVCPTISPMVSYTRWMIQPTVAILGSAVAITVRVEL